MTANNGNNNIEQAASAKRINTMVGRIRRSYEGVQERVQQCAIAIVEHANLYGDCTQAKNLCRAIPARERNSLVGWFMLVSPIGVLLDKSSPAKDKARFIKEDSKAYNPFDLDKANALKWYDDPAGVNPAADPVQVYGGGVYDMLLGMIGKVMEDKLGKGKEATEEAVKTATELKAVIEQYRAKAQASVAASNTGNDATPEVNMPVGVAA